MAITVIPASRVTDGAVSFIVRGLDSSYELDDRRCYVSVKKYGDIDVWYEVYPDDADDFKISAGDTAFSTGVITGIRLTESELSAFEKNTKYVFLLEISYTENGKTMYSETQIEYTFGELVPTLDGQGQTLQAPVISSFSAYQTADGEKSVTVEWTIENLTAPSVYGDDYGATVVISVDGKKKYYYCDTTSDSGKRTYAVADFGVYEVFVEAINEDGTNESATKSGVVTVKVREFSGAYTLECVWEESKVLNAGNFTALSGTNAELVCVKYPSITADNFNKFCLGINALRKLAGLPEYGLFVEAVSGEPMTAQAFTHTLYAVKAIYDAVPYLSWDEAFPQGEPALNGEITEAFVSGLDGAVWRAKEQLCPHQIKVLL